MPNHVARRFRNRPTLAEKVLWDELRELRRQGYHFRRQAPIDDLIVDFACFGQRLIIEVDGIQHEEAANRAADAVRDAHFHHHGFNVLRFSNGDVMENVDGVMLEVLAALGAIVRHD